jgi:hypothetical protein
MKKKDVMIPQESKYETVNAIITGASISNDDHGCLSSWIHLEHERGGQGFGGFALYLPSDFTHSKIDTGYAGHWIWRIMEIAGVSRWDDLKGKTIRCITSHSNILAIGNIIKDEWFCPSQEFGTEK